MPRRGRIIFAVLAVLASCALGLTALTLHNAPDLVFRNGAGFYPASSSEQCAMAVVAVGRLVADGYTGRVDPVVHQGRRRSGPNCAAVLKATGLKFTRPFEWENYARVTAPVHLQDGRIFVRLTGPNDDWGIDYVVRKVNGQWQADPKLLHAWIG